MKHGPIRMPALAAAGILGLAFTVAPARGYAQSATAMSLAWDAPPGCPQLGAVRDRVRAIAGPPTEREARLQASGTVTKEEGKFRLRLEVRDGELTGERVIQSASCDDLAGAAAVALGLLLRSAAPLTQSDLQGEGDVLLPPAQQENQTKPKDQQGPNAARPRVDEPADEQQHPSEPRAWGVLLRAPHLVADWGPLPRPSLGLALGLGAQLGRVRALAVGKYWLNQTVRGDELPGYSASFARQSLELSVCHGTLGGRYDFGPCVAASVEQARARGAGEGVTPRESTIRWAVFGASAFGSVRLFGGLSLVAELGLRIQTSRPVVEIAGLGELARLRPLAATTALSAEWRF